MLEGGVITTDPLLEHLCMTDICMMCNKSQIILNLALAISVSTCCIICKTSEGEKKSYDCEF